MAKIIVKEMSGGLNGYNIVHYKSPWEPDTSYLNKKALCGAAYTNITSEKEEINLSINCPKCIKIMKYCKETEE